MARVHRFIWRDLGKPGCSSNWTACNTASMRDGYLLSTFLSSYSYTDPISVYIQASLFWPKARAYNMRPDLPRGAGGPRFFRKTFLTYLVSTYELLGQ
jgi:hypothetical protein